MELTEVGRRILVRRWRLIAALTAAGTVVAFVVFATSPTYTATARLVLNTPDPTDRAAAIAIADTGNALATSPAEVTRALHDAHVSGRDGAAVAKHVSVRGLGTSGVLQLSVTDRNRHVATAVANALAVRVIDTRRSLTSGETTRTLATLQRQISSLNRRMAVAEAAGEAPLGRARIQALIQRRNALESAWTTLVSVDAQRPRPQVVSRAGLPERADPSPQWPDTILGALLGLVLGVALAGLLEMLRPTVVGGDALAAEFDVPLLGTVDGDPSTGGEPKELTAVATRLRLAADAAAIRDIVLAGSVPTDELEWLATRLQDLQQVTASAPPVRGERRAVPRIAVFCEETRAGAEAGTGFVLVLPSSVEKRQLLDLAHLLRVAASPLLGVITLRPTRGAPSLRLRIRGRGTDTRLASAS